MITPYILAICIILALILGSFVAWYLMKHKAELAKEEGRSEGRVERATLEERLRGIEATTNEAKAERDSLRRERDHLATAKTELETTLSKERLQTDEKLALLNSAKEELANQFKVLANEIFDEKTQRFADESSKNLSTILDPLKEKLTDFKAKVEETYDKESQQRISLQEEIKRLVSSNMQISTDAVNLTKALKGDSKTQGTWGEVILERTLERSGLTKNREYTIQESFQQHDGTRTQPDVIVYLPDSKHIVIDSKVSLKDYERYCSEENTETRQVHLRGHLASIRTHVQSLSAKNYQAIYKLNSLDFVLMFVPIEAAFLTAVQEDDGLYTEAYCKNIMIVSPSTLLPTLRTIANIWKQEKQSRNAQDIARQAAALYDKLVGFVSNLDTIGKKLTDAQGAYQDAYKQLVQGKGNIIRQAEKLKELGVQPSKTLSQPLIEASKADEETFVAHSSKTSPSPAFAPNP